MAYTVLLCDDALFMRTMVKGIVTKAGFEVVGEAENGRQVVDEYRRLKPDVVLLDIVLPDVSGIVALREIREQDPQARVVMCSSMGQQLLIQEAIGEGAKGFIVKPFNASRVLQALNDAVN